MGRWIEWEEERERGAVEIGRHLSRTQERESAFSNSTMIDHSMNGTSMFFDPLPMYAPVVAPVDRS